MIRRISLLVILPLALAACRKEPLVDWATREKVFLLGNGSEPKALDPQLISSVNDSVLAQSLFEGLVNFHPSDDLINEPGVAERWESNPNHTIWTFYLRKDAKWSNGDPVTAHDFAYAYQRILSPGLGSPYASMLYFLKNGQAFNEKKITDFAQVGVKALDDYTLQCTLELPAAYFPEVAKHTSWLPVHRGTIEKFGTMTDRFTAWQKPGNHVGNGPFKLKSWRVNHSVVVEKNPHYWDAKTVKLKEIRFFPINSEFTEEMAFKDGQLHATYGMLPPNLISWYRKNRPEVMDIFPYTGVYFYRCHVKKPPLDNPKVRLALALAVDRKTLVEKVLLANQIPATGFTPPIKGIYEPPRMLDFDPERARKVLAEAGYPGGKNFPGFEIFFNTLESHQTIAQAVQAMWKEHLGIGNITLRNQEWKVFQSTTQNEEYQMCRYGWIGDYLDPGSFLGIMRTKDSNNYTGWSNADYDRLLKEAALEPDPKARVAKLFAAEEILLTELPVIPLYWYTKAKLQHPSLKNWNPLLLDHHPFKHVDVRIDG